MAGFPATPDHGIVCGRASAIRGWAGAALLFLVTAFLAWLAVLPRPALGTQGRALRVLILAVLTGLARWPGLR